MASRLSAAFDLSVERSPDITYRVRKYRLHSGPLAHPHPVTQAVSTAQFRLPVEKPLTSPSCVVHFLRLALVGEVKCAGTLPTRADRRSGISPSSKFCLYPKFQCPLEVGKDEENAFSCRCSVPGSIVRILGRRPDVGSCAGHAAESDHNHPRGGQSRKGSRTRKIRNQFRAGVCEGEVAKPLSGDDGAIRPQRSMVPHRL